MSNNGNTATGSIEPIPAILIAILILGLIYVSKEKDPSPPKKPPCTTCSEPVKRYQYGGHGSSSTWSPHTDSRVATGQRQYTQEHKSKWQPFEPKSDSRQKSWQPPREAEERKPQWISLEH